MGQRKARRLQREMMDHVKMQVDAYKDEQRIQREVLAKQKQEYRQFKFENPYEGMENYYEDLTVSTQAADFQMEQGAQQRANVMQALQGAAGGSGIAGLAQTLVNQGTLQARQVSMDILQQERQNTMMQTRGASAADMAERGGAAMVQSAEMQRQSTLLGIEYGGMAGDNAGLQAAYGNQMSAFGSQAQIAGAQMGMWGNIVGGALSDRRLKKNIQLIGKSSNELNIYSFEYKYPQFGEGLYQGVMSDEVPQEAIIKHFDGYDRVNYNMLDVEFKQI